MITDLFSHKIHSSSDSWPEKLIEIACVFSEFDGMPYNRSAIEQRLLSISPRASIVARDPSKFRDEISAYPAYLGLYYLDGVNNTWILKLTETAKKYLIIEEPNVPAFLLLQLTLFQYPNGMGFAYNQNTGKLRIQANAKERTLRFINEGIHLSPFRLICKALLADSKLNGIDSFHPRVSVEEIFILANDSAINKHASPDIEIIVERLKKIRRDNEPLSSKFEKRLHILNHTDFIQVTNDWIHLRETVSPEDSESLIKKLHIINSIDLQFNGFDSVKDEQELKSVIYKSEWGRYFDGLVSLNADNVYDLTSDNTILETVFNDFENFEHLNHPLNYPLRQRDEYPKPSKQKTHIIDPIDPEVTRIRRQRSHLEHKILTQKMDEYLRNLGATPFESEHIDLFAKIPNDGSYLFEVKSVSAENLLSQSRKGLSQLYEYKYRYTETVGNDVILCLVYPKEPKEIDWLLEYLCKDRGIAVCWFEGETLCFPDYCEQMLKGLIA